MTFKDHFSEQAAAYAASRPRYPEALFDFLANLAPGHRVAWDCATGSGQAALGLVPHFKSVVATDASEAQLVNATPHPRITYRRASAEESGLADGSMDMITVAQALHWFDRPAFYAEAARVLMPGGVLAAWCYNLLTIEPEIDALLNAFYTETVGAYWPPERTLVEEGYRSLEFPFEEVAAPHLEIEQSLTLPGLAGYLESWSAVQGYKTVRGEDPVPAVRAQLSEFWGEPDRPRVARWPLSLRIGYHRR